MKIYVRKILNHDVTHEVSITNDIVNNFFDGQTAFTMRGKTTNESGVVTINSATDPRFGGVFKSLLRSEGDIEVDDIILIYKERTYYELEIVKTNNNNYDTLINLFKPNERHTVVYTEDEQNLDMAENEEPQEENEEDKDYTKDKFLEEVFIGEDKYDAIVSLLKKKKNIILQGAPGVGKTYIAKRLAYSIIGKKQDSQVKCIQFNQSYSYEEFIEGYRPTEESFELKPGIFYKFCELARANEGKDYYLIIDEINRGNLSKIFGELLMLIEGDKRKEELELAYSDKPFSVPDNLYIIGLMNTADRSLALIDYALRRRFSFIKIKPAYDSEKFKNKFNEIFDEPYVEVMRLIEEINNDIKGDPSLGEGFMIGHSYFCPKIEGRKGNKKDIVEILKYDILPLIEEYWYDDQEKLDDWQQKIGNMIIELGGKIDD